MLILVLLALHPNFLPKSLLLVLPFQNSVREWFVIHLCALTAECISNALG